MNPSNPHAVKDGGTPVEELFHVGLRWRFFERLQEASATAGLTGPDALAEMLASPRFILAACSSSMVARNDTRNRSVEEIQAARANTITLIRKWESDDAREELEKVFLEGEPQKPRATVSLRLSLPAELSAKLFEASASIGVPVSVLASSAIGAQFESELSGRFVPVLLPIASARRLLQGEAITSEGGAR